MNDLTTTNSTPDQAQEDKRDRPSEFWLREISAAEKREKNWRNEALDALRRYTLEGNGGKVEGANKFNILWSNTETLRNAVYNQPPKPNVRQRWATKDPTALAAAEVLDRALTYSIERSGLNAVAVRVVLDFLLPGRSVVRVRYVPEIETRLDPAGNPYEHVAHESVMFDNVSWNDFVHGDARTWENVPWVAFRHWISQEEAKHLFPGKEGTLQYSSRTIGRGDTDEDGGENRTEGDTPADARACVWEVWDRRGKRVYWVSKGASAENGDVLLSMEPPLDLEGFFPCPRPLYAIEQPDSLTPMPFYSQYKEQAVELDKVSERIRKMAAVVKWRGVYDTALGDDIARILNEGQDGSLIPSDAAAQWVDKGGLSGAIFLMPLEQAVAALKTLYESREQTKRTIYEITGISDILRGDTNANETATAQQIKAQWGSSRVDGMKREIQRFFRDLLVIAAEVSGECFGIDTLREMTGVDLPTAQEKEVAQTEIAYLQKQQQAMQAQGQQMMQPGGQAQDIPPEIQQGMKKAQSVLQKPSWEDVKGLLSSDKMRGFRVDIETDSTIAPDQRQEMQAFGETMKMIGGLLQQLIPGIQSGVIPSGLGMALLGATIRKTPLSNEMSGIFEQYESELSSGNPMQKQMNAMKKENEQLKAENQNKKGELQIKAMDIQAKAKESQGQQAIDMADLQLRAAEMQQRERQALIRPRGEMLG